MSGMREQQPSFTIDDRYWPISYHPWLNLISSVLGYLLFVTIVHVCEKKHVLGKIMHDVMPILLFALVCDILETGRTLYFLANLKEGESLETVSTKCTFVFWLAELHYMLPYAQAVIAIHRFMVGFCRKPNPACTVYIGFGIVFGAQATLIIADFAFGSAPTSFGVPHVVMCKSIVMVKEYGIYIFVAAVATAQAITVTLTTMNIIKGFVKKELASGVSVFLLFSSPVVLFCLLAFVAGIFVSDEYARSFALYTKDFGEFVIAVIFHIENFRLPLLCLFAIMIIRDIRGAVYSTVSEAIQKMIGRKRISMIGKRINHGIHLETEEKKQFFEAVLAQP